MLNNGCEKGDHSALLADLALLTGNIGRRGVGVNPLRGQNNVQGSADMGVQPHQGAGYLDVTNEEVNQRYNQFYGVDVPKEIGYKIPEMFEACQNQCETRRYSVACK